MQDAQREGLRQGLLSAPLLLITFTTTVIWIRAIVLTFTMEKIYLVYHERSSFFDRELTQRTYLLEL
ncbi:MAG: hypothetical protein ACJ8CB_26250 [Ktedonobacteraceae bacterium]|jgi:hypothetical protein